MEGISQNSIGGLKKAFKTENEHIVAGLIQYEWLYVMYDPSYLQNIIMPPQKNWEQTPWLEKQNID